MVTKDKDYYAVLDVDPSADSTIVEHAYWRLAWTLQVATRTDPSAHERLEELNEAYSVLGTPALRAEYDRARPTAPPEPETGEKPTLSVLRLPLRVAGMTLGLVRGLSRLPPASATAWSRLDAALGRLLPPLASPRLPGPTRTKKPPIDSADLRASTAETIARWRMRAEVAPPLLEGEASEKATCSTENADEALP